MTKIKFPSKIKIQNQTWTVEFCDVHERLQDMTGTPLNEFAELGLEGVLGFCDAARRSICIDSELSDGAKAEVLVHEIGHAYNAVLPSTFAGDDDELFAKLFATSVMDFILNNQTGWVAAGS